MTIETLSEQRCHGGVQGFYQHDSEATGSSMRFAVYRPPAAEHHDVPVVYYLAGLTCTEETATVKAGAQPHAARLGLMLVMPDTSPRGTGLPGDDADWDFGSGAGFYLDAVVEPWSRHYRMESYITNELAKLVEGVFPVRAGARGITGHSMGGHGALTLALRHPRLYRSVSAFAPVCAPCRCPWGRKAFAGYLGDDPALWQAHDATELIRAGRRCPPILVDQGADDQFLAEQLHPHMLETACRDAGLELELRRHVGYDHSYYFVQSFIGDHLEHHARSLDGV